MERNEIPLGFGFALAQNPEAMKKFANLSESGQSAILQKVHGVSSKDEMQSVVDALAAQN